MLKLSNICSIYNQWKPVYSENDSSRWFKHLYKDGKIFRLVSHSSSLFSDIRARDVPRDEEIDKKCS